MTMDKLLQKHRTRSVNGTAGRDLGSLEAAAETPCEKGSAFERSLNTTWFSGSTDVIALNSYPNGVTLSLHQNINPARKHAAEEGEEPQRKLTAEQFSLRLRETRDYQAPHGKFFVHKNNVRAALERHFSRLHKEGRLKQATLYFGTIADPFAAFHKRFNNTMLCLQLLEQYRPKRLVVQTRSPMIIAALPTLKELGERCVVGIPVETHLERAVLRYTPGQSKISERLVAAQGLRRQGVKVNLQAAPILPYGDFSRDAWDFAELLDRYGDFITVSSLASGSLEDEKALKELPIARKLAADRQFFWLRPNAYRHVLRALEVIAPEKVRIPSPVGTKAGQLGLFAA